MCGILGKLYFSDDSRVSTVEFNRALDLQTHRGPDDSDIVRGDDYIFGHRRLSIIDLDTHAKQPMVSDCDGFILTFNGEIYNYKELREELLVKGYRFNTQSDTEVLLNSYIEYGIQCVDSFIGMFAFSIYDRTQRVTYIVRDRLGIKPLYYSNDGTSLTFSSEIKSILDLDNDAKRSLNLDAVSSYLSFRYPILNDTFFKGIHCLPPAHYMKISDLDLELVEYWNVVDKFSEQKVDKGEDYYVSELRRLLKSAVEYRMISDVPIGSYLSGGVDSSIITALMAENSKDPIKTFTIGFAEEGYNEFQYANIIKDKYGTNHREIMSSGQDYFDTMESLIGFKDAPLSVPNEVPLYLMTKELKKSVTVVLSGEGADEIFGGYGRIFKSPYDYERIRDLDSLDLSDFEKRELSDQFIRKYIKSSFDNEVDHFINIYSYTGMDEKKELLSSSIDLKEIENKLFHKFSYYFDELPDDSYYNKLLYTFEKIHLVGLLQRVDVTTMACSVEARVPFVDHRLVEFAFTIPFKYKIKWNSKEGEDMSKLLMSSEISELYDTPKYILKKSYEGIIPDEILYRKKVGFPAPLNSWLGGDFNSYAKRLLLSKEATNRNLYNSKNVKKWLDSDKLQSDHGVAMKIWMLINIEIFLKKYF
jgi:asparagine synthase (glutamine-hydrolysing)